MCCLWSNELFSTDAVRQYLDGCGEEITYQITENTKTIDYMEKDGVKLSNGIMLELPETVNCDMLSPRMPKGETPEMPGPDEIWVTTKMTNILKLEAGDGMTLQLAGQSVRVRVAKIVADPVFGSSSTNVYRMWCGFGRLSYFPLAENNAASYLEVRFREYTPLTEQNFIRDAEKQFHVPLGDTIYTYDRIKGGYTSAWQMVGAALCFVNVILAVAVIALTLFLIRSDMDEDIRNIGIYKALGMTGEQITGMYRGCYGIISLIGAFLGSVLGGGLSGGLITKVLRDIGLYAVFLRGIGVYQLLAGIFMPVAVITVCLCTVFKVRKLNAAYAVRAGCWQMREGKRKEPGRAYDPGGVSFELYYAVRGMQNKKLRYAYIAGVSLILGCLTVIGLGCLNAVKNIDREPEI